MNNRKEHCCIYIHTNLINKKVYIGQTQFQDNLNARFGKDGYGYKDSARFYNAIKKYGWKNFSHQILEKDLSKEEANNREVYWIQKYNATDPNFGYNISLGGNCGSISEETKEKISNTKKNNYHPYRGQHLTPEHRAKISQAEMGSKNHFYGKHHSEESKKKMSEHHADVSKENNPNAQKIYCEELNMTFNSMVEAAEFLGKDKVAGATNIRIGIKKRGGYAYGYHWQRIEKESL